MGKKILDSLLQGALIFVVGLFVIAYFVNLSALQQAQKQLIMLDGIDRQKVFFMKKLAREVEARQGELNASKKELESSRAELESVAKELTTLKTTLAALSK